MFRRLKSRYLKWLVARRAIPDPLWRQTLQRTPYARRLSADAQLKLRNLSTQFLIEKHFSSTHGLRITDAMRVRVAVKACLPILELGLDYYAEFKEIVLYPYDFRARDRYTDEAGIVHEETRDLDGQALSHGPMVLSWNAVEADRNLEAKDVVVHECAHKLDMLNGRADGFPPIHTGMSAQTWTSIFQTAYRHFCLDIEARNTSRIDAYATENPAEFFAVTSETFFTRPEWLAEDMPDVYSQLSTFYRQDPLSNGAPS